MYLKILKKRQKFVGKIVLSGPELVASEPERFKKHVVLSRSKWLLDWSKFF